MPATRNEISKWFDEGVEQNKKFMVVLCDTFDWFDYPSYHSTRQSAEREKNLPGYMQRVMEVYDLEADKAEQLNKARVMAL